MTESEREARREYFRRWRKANPDRVKANQERFWARKAQELNGASTELNKPDVCKKPIKRAPW